ncbi:hypothetical protein LEN26_020362 [Aphanomyces euteiches]|nr:hypothetical protein LEN26_020362 [Aphanomyces euteiches]KAH9129432.1 hypothetical protein AeMF1_000538 [Aphanomyces euteiches]
MSDATASPNATVASEARIAPPQGVIRSIIIIVFGISFYLPLVILVYYCNRHKPPLRYRNPFEMALTATAAFLYTCSRCMGSLFVDEISCTFRLLSFGVPLNFGLVGYVLAELRVVLMFNLTELMVAHAQKASINQSKLSWLHTFFRRGLHSTYRFLIHGLWNIPLFVILYSQDYSAYKGDNCPTSLNRQISTLFSTNFVLVILASLFLSFKMSKVVDNFGLRWSFQVNGRITFVYFAIYFPILVFFFDSAIVLDYRIDLFIEIIIAHTVIWIHIVIPLRNTLAMPDLEHDNGKFTGTVGILDAYLHTPEGFQAFSTFAKSEFRFECVHAWKTLVDYQLDAPDHLSAFEIYELHIAPNAPLPLDKVISPSILKRYALAFEANSKYSVAPEEMVRDKNYFAVLLDAVMDKILVDSLPRFQVHPLGAGWNDFVAKYNTQMTLDRVLESELDANGKPILKSKKTMPTIKNDMYRSSGHLIPIESRRESILQSSANADNDDISITASVKLTDLKYHPR